MSACPPSTVAEFLDGAELGRYKEAFEEEGWDSLTQLRKIKPEQLAILISDVKMKSGHVQRLHEALGMGAEPTAQAPAAPVAQGEAAPSQQAAPSASGGQEPPQASGAPPRSNKIAAQAYAI